MLQKEILKLLLLQHSFYFTCANDLRKENEIALQWAEIRMVRWMC